MATAQLSLRAKFLKCRGSFGTFGTRAVESALQNLLTRPRPLVSHATEPSRFDGVCRSKTHSHPFVDVRHQCLLETAFLREISEGTSH